MDNVTVTYKYDESKQIQECPDHTKRDRNLDLYILASTYVVSPPSEHTIENKDLLSLYVCRALHIDLRVNWGRASDEEVARIGVFQDYCCDLFAAVTPYILESLQKTRPPADG